MDTSGPKRGDPYLGLVLDGQFELEAQLGSGSMAVVYRARHLTIERDVAVKVLRHELLNQSELVERFKREARIAAKLEHPNVIVVHAVGELPVLSDEVGGEPYVTLELLLGPSLADLLSELGGVLPLSRALHIVLAICDAIGEGHARGIVHRDVKPENVMLVRRGGDPDFVKVLDFGLAKTLDATKEFHTRAGSVLGTPRYVSPEGAEGRAVSAASDCYSIATLLYRCLAGRTPFDGESAVKILVQQSSAEPPELRSIGAARDVPEAIARVIMSNLSKRPEARASDARVLGRALVDAARSAGVDSEQIGLPSTLLGSTRRWNQKSFDRMRVASAARPIESRAEFAESAPVFSSSRGPRTLSTKPETKLSEASWLVRRLALVIAFFVLGGMAALGVASRLGAFAEIAK